jgi:hypothetical protein
MELTPDLLKTVAFIARLPYNVQVHNHGKHGIKPWGVSVTLPPGWEFQTLDVHRTTRHWPAATKVRAEEMRALIIAGIAARMIQPDAYVSPVIAFPCLKFTGYPATPAPVAVGIPAQQPG